MSKAKNVVEQRLKEFRMGELTLHDFALGQQYNTDVLEEKDRLHPSVNYNILAKIWDFMNQYRNKGANEGVIFNMFIFFSYKKQVTESGIQFILYI